MKQKENNDDFVSLREYLIRYGFMIRENSSIY